MNLRPLQWALAALVVVGATGTLTVPGVLNGTAAMNGSARGTALVMLVFAVPTLLAATVLAGPDRAGRSSRPATMVQLGTLGYLVYNSILFVFGTPFNELFLVYVAMLGLSIFTLVVLGHRVQVEAVEAVERRLPSVRAARGVAIFIGTIVVANTIIWLGGVIPALGSADAPPFLRGTGLITNPIYVQDLSVWLPLAGLAAVQLWKRHPWGVVLAGGLLSMWVLEGLSVAMDQWFGARADPQSSVVSSSMVLPFLVLAAVTAVALGVLLRQIATAHPEPRAERLPVR